MDWHSLGCAWQYFACALQVSNLPVQLDSLLVVFTPWSSGGQTDGSKEGSDDGVELHG